jgi:hypothetical protein
MLAPRLPSLGGGGGADMPKGDSDDPDRRSGRKWKNEQLRKPIKWTGPTLPMPWAAPALSAQSPLKALLNLAPTEAEIEEHQRSWNEADNKYREEQLRKLPLLTQEYALDTPNEVAQAELIADTEAVKHRWQEGRRRKCSDRQACRILVSTARYKPRYGDHNRGQSTEKRVCSLNNRLVEARNGKSWVARLLANADGKIKQLLTDEVISLFTCDPSEARAARTRADALQKSMTDELKELEARA